MTDLLILAVLFCLLLAFTAYQAYAHALERAAWVRERQLLTERLVDVPLVERLRLETRRAYGTEEDEFLVSERRKARGKTT